MDTFNNFIDFPRISRVCAVKPWSFRKTCKYPNTCETSKVSHSTELNDVITINLWLAFEVLDWERSKQVEKIVLDFVDKHFGHGRNLMSVLLKQSVAMLPWIHNGKCGNLSYFWIDDRAIQFRFKEILTLLKYRRCRRILCKIADVVFLPRA